MPVAMYTKTNVYADLSHIPKSYSQSQSQKYFIQVNTQSYHTTLERLKPIWAYVSHCVMHLHTICDYLFIDQRNQQQHRC